jgi:hypothetical protein
MTPGLGTYITSGQEKREGYIRVIELGTNVYPSLG